MHCVCVAVCAEENERKVKKKRKRKKKKKKKKKNVTDLVHTLGNSSTHKIVHLPPLFPHNLHGTSHCTGRNRS